MGNVISLNDICHVEGDFLNRTELMIGTPHSQMQKIVASERILSNYSETYPNNDFVKKGLTT